MYWKLMQNSYNHRPESLASVPSRPDLEMLHVLYRITALFLSIKSGLTIIISEVNVF